MFSNLGEADRARKYNTDTTKYLKLIIVSCQNVISVE